MKKPSSITQSRREREKQLRKLLILDAAEAVMTRDGFQDFSMDAIAKEAELAKGTLYLYYKSKEEIIAQLTLKARRLLLATFHEHVAKHDDPLQQIGAILWGNYYFNQSNRLYSDLLAFYEVNRELEESNELRQSGLNISAFIVSIVDRAKKQKLVRADLQATEFAYLLWGMCVGTVQLINVKHELLDSVVRVTGEDFFAGYVDLVMHAIRA